MNKSYLTIATFLMAFVLVGAGCISFKGSEGSATFGVWKSIDGGAQWALSSALPTPTGVGTISGVSVGEFVLDPSDRFATYLGTMQSGLFYSWDAAAGWDRPRSTELREGRIRSIAVDPSDKCTLYVSRGQKLHKSEDCGRTFNPEAYVDTRIDVVISDVQVDWFNPDIVYITTTDGDVIKSSDKGRSWATIYRSGGEIKELLIDSQDSRILMVATARRGLHRSTDSGLTWTDILKQDKYDKMIDVRKMSSVSQDSQGKYTWASTEFGLIKSMDRGESWEAVPLLTKSGQATISALAVDPQDGSHVVYSAGSTLYLTYNAGAQWDTEKMPSAGLATQLMFDPKEANVIYMGVRAVETQGGLF